MLNKKLFVLLILTVPVFSQSVLNDNFYNNTTNINFNGSSLNSNFNELLQTSLQTPGSFYLGQVSPNPFSSENDIYVSVPKGQQVKIILLNMFGQKIEEILNSRLKEGTYKVRYDSSKLSPGVYFYMLQGDGYSEMKKMPVIK